MEHIPISDALPATGEDVAASVGATSDPAPHEPESTSALSSAPTTDENIPSEPPAPQVQGVSDGLLADEIPTRPQLSPKTENVIEEIKDNAANAIATGTPEYDAAREQVMRDMQTSSQLPTSTPTEIKDAPQPAQAQPSLDSSQAAVKAESQPLQAIPAASGRGRGGGRPRGRGSRGGRGGKRKREKSDDDSEGSEIYTPAVTTTKSGRSVQKPTSFVPPPASPTNSSKRKRPYVRKNPETAVCKMCLRGVSPADNMIVFCDGCNSPYHQYCHHPPIDPSVVNEVDKEWYCKQCEKERVLPVPETEVANFISAEGASLEQRQRYFASLPPGMLVTLLTKATTLRPDLPVFAPDFRARIGSSTSMTQQMLTPTSTNGHSHPQSAAQLPHPTSIATTYPSAAYSTAYANPQSAGDASQLQQAHLQQQQRHQQQQQQLYLQQQYGSHHYGPGVHPPNYPQPGHGLMRDLHQQQGDLQWLVDDDDRYGGFSHMYNVSPGPHAAINGRMGRPAQ